VLGLHNLDFLVKVTTPSGRATSIGNPQKIPMSYVIASIEAPLKSAVWRSKFVIFRTCATFFEIFLLHCVGLAVLVHVQPVFKIGGFHNTSTSR
jgi:hypothetical protein